MKEKIMSCLPFIYAYYTIIILVSAIYNLFCGNTHMDTKWFIELFIFLVVFVILDNAFANINFKSYLSCAITETLAAYFLFLVFGYFLKWVSFTLEGLVPVTILFIIIAVIGITYMSYRHKLCTEEINELLKKKNE